MTQDQTSFQNDPTSLGGALADSADEADAPTGESAAGTIVVGVDGSEPSKDAVRWAVRQAALSGLPVRAVACWEWPSGWGYGYDYLDLDPAKDTRVLSQGLIDQVQSQLSEAGEPAGAVPVSLSVLSGYPASRLVEASAGATLLVVGSHGRGALGRMLLGSVSLHCAAHAPCPVVIVRTQDGPADG